MGSKVSCLTIVNSFLEAPAFPAPEEEDDCCDVGGGDDPKLIRSADFRGVCRDLLNNDVADPPPPMLFLWGEPGDWVTFKGS